MHIYILKKALLWLIFVVPSSLGCTKSRNLASGLRNRASPSAEVRHLGIGKSQQIREKFKELNRELNRFTMIEDHTSDSFDDFKKELEKLTSEDFKLFCSQLDQSKLDYLKPKLKSFITTVGARPLFRLENREADLFKEMYPDCRFIMVFNFLNGESQEKLVFGNNDFSIDIDGKSYTLSRSLLPKPDVISNRIFYSEQSKTQAKSKESKNSRKHRNQEVLDNEKIGFIKVVRNSALDFEEPGEGIERYFYTVIKINISDVLREELQRMRVGESFIKKICEMKPSFFIELAQKKSTYKSFKQIIKGEANNGGLGHGSLGWDLKGLHVTLQNILY